MEQRLIDANALRAKCDEPHWCVWMSEIDDAPTVDAVPVVRCCECVHKRLLNKEEMRFYGSGVLACTRQRTYNDPLVEVNHFCAYGKRRRDSDGLDQH